MPEIGTVLREGKGKKIYATDDPDQAIVFFKDEAMSFHGLKRGRILGKGEVNNQICEHLFSLLALIQCLPHVILLRQILWPAAEYIYNIISQNLMAEHPNLHIAFDPGVMSF